MMLTILGCMLQSDFLTADIKFFLTILTEICHLFIKKKLDLKNLFNVIRFVIC